MVWVTSGKQITEGGVVKEEMHTQPVLLVAPTYIYRSKRVRNALP